jgi:hypothetical protein
MVHGDHPRRRHTPSADSLSVAKVIDVKSTIREQHL